MRNGNRWRIYAIDPSEQRVAARRVSDGARTVFTGDDLRDHITHGYALTVHAAQGSTADTTRAVLSESTTRALFYVAMSRVRRANTAYLTEQLGGDKPDRNSQPELADAVRGTSQHAAELARSIIANDGDQARTAHGIAAEAPADSAGLGHVAALQSRWLQQITDRGTALQDRQRSIQESQTRSIAGRTKAGKQGSTTESNSGPGIRTGTAQKRLLNR